MIVTPVNTSHRPAHDRRKVNDDRQYQFPTMEALEKAQKYVHVFAKRHSPRWRFQTRILPALRLWVQRFE